MYVYTLIYLQFGEICAGSHHVPASEAETAAAASLLCGRNQDISDLGVPCEILLPEHIVFITVIYYLYIVYVIALHSTFTSKFQNAYIYEKSNNFVL